MPLYVYILYSVKYDRYYIGQTQSVQDRLKRHNHGLEKATSPFIPWELVIYVEKASRAEAMILEKKLKNLNRPRLQAFIEKYGPGAETIRNSECLGADSIVGIRIPLSPQNPDSFRDFLCLLFTVDGSF